jgi:hypothetical protein
MEVPQKIKNKTIIWLISPITGYVAKGNEITRLKRCLHSSVHHSTIHNSHEMEKPRYTYTDVWTKKKSYMDHNSAIN